MTKRYEWYAKKHFLIISEVAEFRIHLTKMLESFGVKRIQTAKDITVAQALYARQPAHYVISDFEYQNGSDALQLLRNLQLRGEYKFRSVFIVCCSAHQLDRVRSALFHAPDDIWQPPLQKADVRARLDQLMVMKAALKHIETALDQAEYQSAVQLAQEKVGRVPKLAFQCLRMMALAFIRQGEFEQALQVYQRVLKNAEHAWALLGQAICQQELGQYLNCIESCDLVLDKHSYCVDAYLQKAESLGQLNQLPQAHQQLTRATELEANNLQVLRKLGRLSLQLKDMDTFASCFRKMMTVADSNATIALDTEDWINYARGLFYLFLNKGPVRGKRFLNELQELLKKQQRRFNDAPQAVLALQLIQARMMAHQNDPDGANQLIDEVLERCLSLHPELMLREEAELTYEACPDLSAAEQLHQELNQGMTIIYPVAPDHERSQTLNRDGMNLYQQGKFTAAKQRFIDAFRYAPDSVSVALNLLQTLLKLMEQQGRNEDDIDRCRRCLLAAQSMPQADKRRQHLDVLTIKLNDIRYRQQEDQADV